MIDLTVLHLKKLNDYELDELKRDIEREIERRASRSTLIRSSTIRNGWRVVMRSFGSGLTVCGSFRCIC